MLSLLYCLADRLRQRARRRGIDPDLAAGRRGEDLAHRFLRRQGFTIVARNFRPRSAGAGEVDLIAWERARLVFVEVKSRATDDYGTPDPAVNSEKQRYIERAPREDTRPTHVALWLVRFDVVNL